MAANNTRTTKTGRPVGRPPKPVEKRRAQGAQGLPAAPSPGEGLPGMGDSVPSPPQLGADGVELWNTLWTAGSRWLSPESDFTMMKMLCNAVDEMEQLRRSILLDQYPRFYTTANGQVVTHPVVKQVQELRMQITTWLSSLGFSPSDRARLGLQEVRTADVLDDLAKRRAERAASVQRG